MSILASFGRPGASFYGPGTEHELVRCSDCGQWADRDMGGDHGGDCLSTIAAVNPRSALGIIRRHALNQPRFSSEDCRAEFDQAGVPPASRGPAFGAAKKRGWIEVDGYAPSTSAKTKNHPVATYKSLVYVERREAS